MINRYLNCVYFLCNLSIECNEIFIQEKFHTKATLTHRYLEDDGNTIFRNRNKKLRLFMLSGSTFDVSLHTFLDEK